MTLKLLLQGWWLDQMQTWTLNPYADIFSNNEKSLIVYINGEYKTIFKKEIIKEIVQSIDGSITLDINLINEPATQDLFVPFSKYKDISRINNGKISFHSDFYIISGHKLCHECILRWLPRNRKLDKYISLLTGNTGWTLLKKASPSSQSLNNLELSSDDSFKIIDMDGSLLFEDNTPPIHPECTKNKHKYNFADFQSHLKSPFKDKFKSLVWYTSLQHEDELGNFHVMCVINAPSNIEEKFLNGWGIDKDLQKAKLKAMVEAVERFHTFLPPQNVKPIYANQKLISNKKSFKPFLFASDQYAINNFVPYDENEYRWWINTQTLPDNNQAYLPIDYVLLKDTNPNKKPLLFPTSTGMAAHTDQEECIKNSLLEVIERAGQYSFWINNDFNKVLINSLNNINQISNYISLFKKKRLVLHIWIKKVIGLPVVIACLGKKENKENTYIFSSSCNFDVETCIKEALEEVYGQYLHAQKYKQEDIEINELLKPIDHLKFYLKEDHSKYLYRYLNLEEAPIEVYKYKVKTIDQLLKEADQNGLEVFLLDRGSTFSDCMGIIVQQVIIPSLPYLNFTFNDLRLPEHLPKEMKDFFYKVPHPFS